MPAMLFTRDFRCLTGGHLKVADYIRHVRDDGRYDPIVYLTPESDRAAFAALLPERVAFVDTPFQADAHFVAGLDWTILDRHGIAPAGATTVNLVQGYRHVDPAHPSYRFLGRPALRICVSGALTEAVAATGVVGGALVTIRNGVDLPSLAAIAGRAVRRRAVFVAGFKRPDLAARLAKSLESCGIDVDLATGLVPHDEYLARMAAATVAVVLPKVNPEGFFLPALEAMALGSAVVSLASLANAGARDFCRHKETALLAEPDAGALAAAVRRVLGSPPLRLRLVEAARAMSAGYGLDREAAEFRLALTTYLATSGDGGAGSAGSR